MKGVLLGVVGVILVLSVLGGLYVWQRSPEEKSPEVQMTNYSVSAIVKTQAIETVARQFMEQQISGGISICSTEESSNATNQRTFVLVADKVEDRDRYVVRGYVVDTSIVTGQSVITRRLDYLKLIYTDRSGNKLGCGLDMYDAASFPLVCSRYLNDRARYTQDSTHGCD